MKHIVSRMSSYFPNRWPLSYLNLTKNMKTYIRRQQHKKFYTPDIGIRYKSDHNPISVKFKFVQQERGRGNWKFNNNLLGDIEYVDLIKTCILETVNQYKVNNLNQENTEPTLLQFSINDQLFWETLKLMIRAKQYLTLLIRSVHKMKGKSKLMKNYYSYIRILRQIEKKLVN